LIDVNLVATAIVQTVTKQEPFDPNVDTNCGLFAFPFIILPSDVPLAVGVSYVAVFILSYNIVMWMVGGASTLAWDFAPGVPQGDEATARVSWQQKPIGAVVHRLLSRRERVRERPEKLSGSAIPEISDGMEADPEIQLVRRMSRASATSASRPSVSRPVGILDPPIPTNAHPSVESLPLHAEKQPISEPPPESSETPSPSLLQKVWSIVGRLFNPITTAMYISLPIALIPAVKALFVLPSSPSAPYYFVAPDGNPPLYFLLNTASFVGAITVPMTLFLLGASFARLKIPRPFLQKAPLWAIFWVCTAKMVILPVIGIFFVQGLVQRHVVRKEEIVLRFVTMLLSGGPSAVT